MPTVQWFHSASDDRMAHRTIPTLPVLERACRRQNVKDASQACILVFNPREILWYVRCPWHGRCSGPHSQNYQAMVYLDLGLGVAAYSIALSNRAYSCNASPSNRPLWQRRDEVDPLRSLEAVSLHSLSLLINICAVSTRPSGTG